MNTLDLMIHLMFQCLDTSHCQCYPLSCPPPPPLSLPYQFRCCGSNSSMNWLDAPNLGMAAPDSCCMVFSQGCGNTGPQSQFYQQVSELLLHTTPHAGLMVPVKELVESITSASSNHSPPFPIPPLPFWPLPLLAPPLPSSPLQGCLDFLSVYQSDQLSIIGPLGLFSGLFGVSSIDTIPTSVTSPSHPPLPSPPPAPMWYLCTTWSPHHGVYEQGIIPSQLDILYCILCSM